MEPLQLDPGEYSGTYKLIGGHSSLDLVNTLSWPATEREHDWLDTPANARRWAEAVGLEPFDLEVTDLAEFHLVRSVLRGVFQPLAICEEPIAEAMDPFQKLVSETVQRRRLDVARRTWVWMGSDNPRHLLDPVVFDAAALIVEGDPARLKSCGECGWVFEDQTRNRSRRWCDMADCGSRSKARSYYHRHRGPGDSDQVG